MLQYCQASFICLAQESNPGKLRVASRAVPPQRNYAAALWDPKPATSQQQSHTPPTRFLLLLYHLLRLCHFDKWVVIRRVEQAAPLKLRQSGPTQKKSLKNMYKLQNIHENIMQTNAGRRSNCLPCYPIPGTSSLPSLPPLASSHSLRPSLRKKRRKSSLCLPTRPPPLAVASRAQFSAFPFLFLSNEKLLSIKYLLSRRILWHKSTLTVLRAQNVACFSLCFPAIRWPSEIFGA